MTLAELAVSIAVMGILMTGLASAVLVATRALPRTDRPADRITQPAETLTRIVTELQTARYVSERAAHAIMFAVPDRDGNGSPERIRYAWSGVAGDPLTRQYNAGQPVTLLDGVNQFDVACDTKSVTETYPGPPVESSEVLVDSYTASTDRRDYNVDSTHWIGQYVQPPAAGSIPGLVTWRVTRVRFQAYKSGSIDDQTRVQICVPNADKTPSTTVLEEQLLNENTLSAWVWTNMSFQYVAGLAPDQGVCLVLRPLGGNASCTTRYENNGGSDLLVTSNAGQNWSYSAQKSLQFYVYGKAAMPGSNQSITRTYMTGVRLALRVGADTSARLDAGACLQNAPEVLSAVWEAEFDTNPTTLDFNADGTGDWVRHDGQPFNTASLSQGVWHADCTLDTRPINSFAELTTAEICFRNTSVGGNGAVFSINADWSGGTFAPLFAYLQLQGAGTQTLSVYSKRDSSTPVRLMAVTGLPAGFVTLRLLIDPTPNTVNVHVNGAEKGTYTYYTFAQTGSDRFASVLASGSAADFDYVRIHVGGSSP
jgi:hypothetical protein